MLKKKKLRFIELILLLGVVFLPSIIQSFYALFSKEDIVSMRGGSLSFRFLHGIVWEALSLCLLIYFLYRRGKGLKDVGFSFKWKDILSGIILFISITVLSIILQYVLKSLGIKIEQPRNIDFLKGNITILYVLFIIINPFFEELIVRAFTMTEIEYLTGNAYLAALISTLLQTSYHLYQGLYSAFTLAVMFIVYSLFFGKYKRIAPVIIVHALFDIIAMMQFAAR